ncbi:hypothetical protein AAC387_Pa01g0345 [Persea americana]
MANTGDRSSVSRRKNLGFRRTWCCSFTLPKSPENLSSSINTLNPTKSKASSNSFPNSPSPISSTKLGLGLGRRILSPGRVSPIDSEGRLDPLPVIRPESAALPAASPARERSAGSSAVAVLAQQGGVCGGRDFDLRLELRGRNGRILSLELDSEVIRSKSEVFAEKIEVARRRSGPGGCCLIEVGDLGNLEAFRETIELMYEKDVVRRLMKMGVSRAIDILEVSSTIMFDIGIKSCLNYLEAVPWCESEEEKLKSLLSRCTFDKLVAQEVLARLNVQDPVSQPLGLHIIQSVTQGFHVNAKRELKSLVKGLLSTSSVYQKDPAGVNKEDLYRICDTCIHSLEHCFREASDQVPKAQAATKDTRRPLIGRISEQVDNINWLLEILIDRQMAEEFVGLWANQRDLLRMHEKASPMVRYELSRVSASVFIALGTGKLHCRGEERYSVLRAWFEPMLVDFGWLQRCPKGLDVRELEEAMGHALLTLTMKQQESLFMEWFGCFSGHGRECPNLSKAFQVWWRRMFLRATEAQF